MGLFGKPRTHRIMASYSYIPIRDPRKKKIDTEDLIPAIPGGGRAGDEFLEKYLYLVRNHISRDLVADWFQSCALRKDSYIDSVSGNVDEDEFLGYMVHGFSMAAAEYEGFGIAKSDEMADCVWDAMKTFSIQILLESDSEGQKACLAALLSGYHLAKEIQKKNLA